MEALNYSIRLLLEFSIIQSDLYANLMFRKQETKVAIVLAASLTLPDSSRLMVVTLLISEYLHSLIGEVFHEYVLRNVCKTN